MKIPLVLLFLFSLHNSFAQNISATELLNKSIAFHDPQNHWDTFNGNLQVTMETPNNAPRVSNITINLPQEYFSVTAKRDTIVTTYTLDKGVCSTSIKEKTANTTRTPCETATLYKNYYTYLYGLPMKLKDEGTRVSQTVEKTMFKGKEYLSLKVTYEEYVGSDVWYFYFNPQSYAMEAYQFFKTENGIINTTSGEYILLSGLKNIEGIKFPKDRAWYYNKDQTYLGTDTLN